MSNSECNLLHFDYECKRARACNRKRNAFFVELFCVYIIISSIEIISIASMQLSDSLGHMLNRTYDRFLLSDAWCCRFCSFFFFHLFAFLLICAPIPHFIGSFVSKKKKKKCKKSEWTYNCGHGHELIAHRPKASSWHRARTREMEKRWYCICSRVYILGPIVWSAAPIAPRRRCGVRSKIDRIAGCVCCVHNIPFR